VLQCVAVCCSVLQRVAVCCSVLQRPSETSTTGQTLVFMQLAGYRNFQIIIKIQKLWFPNILKDYTVSLLCAS